MNKVEIRDTIVAHLDLLIAKWESEGRPVFVSMENQDVDLNAVGDTFICFHIDWTGSSQKNVAFEPDHRYYGDIFVILFGKTGSGVRERLLLEDEINQHFAFKGLSGVQLKQPTPSAVPGRSGNAGWHATATKFPFFADSDT